MRPRDLVGFFVGWVSAARARLRLPAHGGRRRVTRRLWRITARHPTGSACDTRKAFSDAPLEEREIKFKVQSYLRTDALLCAMEVNPDKILFGGKSGTLILFDASKRQVVDQARLGGGAIRCLG
jgi:hypothetical protein